MTNDDISESTKPTIKKAVDGFDDAVSQFKKTSIPESILLQQYLKGALENMETGRRAVQEKAKFIIPTIFGTLAASATIASFALNKIDQFSPSVIHLILMLAICTSVLSILVSRSLAAVVEATFEFYVAAVSCIK